MAEDTRLPGERVPDDEVPLSGVLWEFRIALREEIEAARRNAASSAVPLVAGRRIGQVGAAFQYAFDIENALNVPGDAPGDLYVPGRAPLDVTVISVEGLLITLSVPEDLGEFVPVARLQSNLTQLMRRLIERIEDLRDRPNPPGERLRGALPVGGSPVPVDAPNMNPEQREALGSVLGRDTTFIWGPPGTGKTRAIGAIGAELYGRGQSTLIVSHTNTAVDQALLQVADALAPEELETGKVIRVGEPRDPRLTARPELLLPTHVARRSAELAAERVALETERDELVDRSLELQRRIDLWEWVSYAEDDIAELRTAGAQLRQQESDAGAAQDASRVLEAEERAYADLRKAANAGIRVEKMLAETAEHIGSDEALIADAGTRVAGTSETLARAEALLARSEEAEPMRVELEGLPERQEQEAILAEAHGARGTKREELVPDVAAALGSGARTHGPVGASDDRRVRQAWWVTTTRCGCCMSRRSTVTCTTARASFGSARSTRPIARCPSRDTRASRPSPSHATSG